MGGGDPMQQERTAEEIMADIYQAWNEIVAIFKKGI